VLLFIPLKPTDMGKVDEAIAAIKKGGEDIE
jgi:hypothetical protein